MPRESDFYSREEAPRRGSPVMFCLCPLMRLQSLQTVMIAALSQLIPLITGHSLCFSTTCYYQDKWQMGEGWRVCNLREWEYVDDRFVYFFCSDWGGAGMKVLVAGSYSLFAICSVQMPEVNLVLFCIQTTTQRVFLASPLTRYKNPQTKQKLLGIHVFYYVWCVNSSTFFWTSQTLWHTCKKMGEHEATKHNMCVLYIHNISLIDGSTSLWNWGKFGSVAEEPQSFIWSYVKSLLSLVDKISAPLSNCPVISSIKDVLMCLMWPRATYQSR